MASWQAGVVVPVLVALLVSGCFDSPPALHSETTSLAHASPPLATTLEMDDSHVFIGMLNEGHLNATVSVKLTNPAFLQPSYGMMFAVYNSTGIRISNDGFFRPAGGAPLLNAEVAETRVGVGPSYDDVYGLTPLRGSFEGLTFTHNLPIGESWGFISLIGMSGDVELRRNDVVSIQSYDNSTRPMHWFFSSNENARTTTLEVWAGFGAVRVLRYEVQLVSPDNLLGILKVPAHVWTSIRHEGVEICSTATGATPIIDALFDAPPGNYTVEVVSLDVTSPTWGAPEASLLIRDRPFWKGGPDDVTTCH